ncbi:hypothetical protein DFH01_06655 [Falsiroseomonas bella]|uniref:DUF484 domain-containing protein n=1 Tax=Falsiroseomonas bella TaxID=2184016 RepID=A0A317FKN5_9PROT|nr:DUF484 family protein [Falsiroseomonas bella]PWS38922.1 hypothetical protein DFH01_06655 [Falsiroseomonas bella]
MSNAAAPILDHDPMAEEVAAFLVANPDFLARRPELYRALTPPKRVHGENLADHMAAMVAAERARLRALEAEMQAAVADGRAGTGLVLRVRLAVLALMRARDVPDTIAHEWPPLLRVESCALLAEAPAARAVINGRAETALPRHGVRILPPGAVARLIGPGRDALVRSEVTERDLLHAEAAPLVVRDALVKVPLWCGTPCLLALGARESVALPARQSAQTLAFLGRAVAAALAR